MTPIEAIQGHLKHIDESLAQVAVKVSDLEELPQKIDGLSEQVASLSDAIGRLETLLGNFIRETERLRATSSQLQSEVRPVLDRLKAMGR